MKIQVTKDAVNTANYICYLAKAIGLGLFQAGGFAVLPYPVNLNKAIYFPDLTYSKAFWRVIVRAKSHNYGDIYPSVAVTEVLDKMSSPTSPASKISYSKIVSKYKYLLSNVKQIDILETEYGSKGSYMTAKNKIIMSRRSDGSPQDFERTLLLAITKFRNKDEAEIGSINWHKRNAIADFLAPVKTTKSNLEMVRFSQDYLKKLGFEPKSEISGINLNNLTRQETDLLNFLTTSSGQVVSFDKVAEILWGEKSFEKYSLQAMAKVVENLRKKIRDSGINRELIFTKRGKGYIFVN